MRLILLITILTLIVPVSLKAFVMGSSSYRMNSDSVNFGGAPSQSTNYKDDATMGEIGTGFSSSTSYSMYAGYQQMQSSYISITSPNDDALPSLNGLAGGFSTASSTWTVLTDNAAGYTLSVRSVTSPALQGPGGASFDDYAPSGADPDYDYTYTATESRFGFTPEGVDVDARFRDNGSICNAGGLDTVDKCWDGLSTVNKIVATGASSNHPNGATTTIKYRAAIGTSKIQDAGSYSTTVIVTATTL